MKVAMASMIEQPSGVAIMASTPGVGWMRRGSHRADGGTQTEHITPNQTKPSCTKRIRSLYYMQLYEEKRGWEPQQQLY